MKMCGSLRYQVSGIGHLVNYRLSMFDALLAEFRRDDVPVRPFAAPVEAHLDPAPHFVAVGPALAPKPKGRPKGYKVSAESKLKSRLGQDLVNG